MQSEYMIQYRAKNRLHLNALARKYYHNNPKAKIAKRAHYLKNRQKQLDRQKATRDAERAIDRDGVKRKNHERYLKHRKKQLARQKADRKQNPEKYKKRHAEAFKKHAAKWRVAAKKKYMANKDSHLRYMRLYAKRNKKKIRRMKRLYRARNAERLRARNRARRANPEYRARMNAQQREWHRKRQATDSGYRIAKGLRARLGSAIRRVSGKKSKKAFGLIGCTIEFLRTHLESQFKLGMAWCNYGKYGWHIDHIRPCASFDLTKPSHQKKCFHYKNLQPLWASENLIKQAQYIPGVRFFIEEEF